MKNIIIVDSLNIEIKSYSVNENFEKIFRLRILSNPTVKEFKIHLNKWYVRFKKKAIKNWHYNLLNFTKAIIDDLDNFSEDYNVDIIYSKRNKIKKA